MIFSVSSILDSSANQSSFSELSSYVLIFNPNIFSVQQKQTQPCHSNTFRGDLPDIFILNIFCPCWPFNDHDNVLITK